MRAWLPEVTVTRVPGSVLMVPEVARRHDPKGPDGREGSTLGPPQRVFPIAGVKDDFAVASAGQIEAAREHVARVGPAVPWVAIALGPARILPVAVVGALAPIMPLIVPVATVVMLLDARDAGAASR